MNRKFYRARDRELVTAYSLLFSDTTIKNIGQLFTLDINKLKDAYRKRVKENHPDRAKLLGLTNYALTERFKDINLAYSTLTSFIQNRQNNYYQYSHQQKRKDSSFTKSSKEKKSNKKESKKNTDKDSFNNFSKNKSKQSSNDYTKSKNNNSFKQKKYSHKQSDFQTEKKTGGNPWIPQISIPLGQYLLFCGIISLKTLIQALLWQRSQRPAYGEIACMWKIITKKDIHLIYQNRKVYEKFGECAMRLGLVSSFQNKAILCKQKNIQKLIGQYFIEQGILTKAELEKYLDILKQHNISLNKKKSGGRSKA